MTLILDTGPIVAALNAQDPDHDRCAALLSASDDRLIPSPLLVEIDYWLVKLGEPRVWSDFVADIARGAYRLAHPTDADLTRAAELESAYADLDLGFVDAVVIAIGERLPTSTPSPPSTGATSQSCDQSTAPISRCSPSEAAKEQSQQRWMRASGNAMCAKMGIRVGKNGSRMCAKIGTCCK